MLLASMSMLTAAIARIPSALGKNDPPLLVRTDPPVILGARQALAPYFPLRS